MEEINGEKYSPRKKQAFILTLVGIILVAAVLVTALLRDRWVKDDKKVVTISGEGKVSYQPDTASINLGVQIDKSPTSKDALDELNNKIGEIIKAVVAAGAKKENISTSDYSLSPAYDYNDGTSKVAGYNARETLRIKIEGVDKDTQIVGKIMAAAGSVGSNSVQGVNYSVSSLNDIRQKARVKAIEDARSKAAELAKAAGISKLEKVVGWQESGSPEPGPLYEKAMAMDGRGAGNVPEAVVPAGTQEVTVIMNVDFRAE